MKRHESGAVKIVNFDWGEVMLDLMKDDISSVSCHGKYTQESSQHGIRLDFILWILHSIVLAESTEETFHIDACNSRKCMHVGLLTLSNPGILPSPSRLWWYIGRYIHNSSDCAAAVLG